MAKQDLVNLYLQKLFVKLKLPCSLQEVFLRGTQLGVVNFFLAMLVNFAPRSEASRFEPGGAG